MAWAVSGNIKGPKGDTGDTGATGPAGAGVQITGTAATYGDLPTGLGSGDAGNAYIVTTDGSGHTGYLYVWDGTAFPADGSGVPFQGPAGATGTAATIAAGSATPLAAGASPTVSNSGTSSAAVFNFGIPVGATGATGAKGDQGDAGATGAAATIAAGTATGLAEGSSPTVNNSGTSSAAIFNFGIPVGATGATGATGLPGADGTNGAKWFNGSGAPGTVAGSSVGDYYLDTTSGDVYTLS